MNEKEAMRITFTITGLLALLLATTGNARGQGTVRLTFDQLPVQPPGYGTTNSRDYFEAGIGVHALGGGFTLRWPGGPAFPDNGTPFLQAGTSTDLFFDYSSSRRFDAVSVDLALYSASSLDPVTVQFVASGYTRGRDIIATTEFTVTGAVDAQGRPLFQTFYFPPEFTGMLYLSVTPMAPLWSLDNLVIYVPEPSVFALLAVGGGLLWAVRRKRIT